MTFAWPWMLLALGAVPLLVLEYRRLSRQRTARRTQLAALGLVAPATAATGRRRHIAPALLLVALTVMFIGLARPQASVAQPRRDGTVVLAFDISSSMRATDLTPTRLDAAKTAARAFVARQPATIRVGVVAFGESGLVMQQPTSDKAGVLAAIDRLTPAGGTALGRGIQASLGLIAGKPVQLDNTGGGIEASGPDLGYHGSAAVILLSDGENTADPDPLEVAKVASTAGVKIYPIGIGSPQGTVLRIDGFQVATALDEDLLRQIASTTNGKYFAAADSAGLSRVYDSIDLAWTVESTRIEVTGLFAATAALLLLLAAGLSFAWFGRVI